MYGQASPSKRDDQILAIAREALLTFEISQDLPDPLELTCITIRPPQDAPYCSPERTFSSGAPAVRKAWQAARAICQRYTGCSRHGSMRSTPPNMLCAVENECEYARRGGRSPTQPPRGGSEARHPHGEGRGTLVQFQILPSCPNLACGTIFTPQEGQPSRLKTDDEAVEPSTSAIPATTASSRFLCCAQSLRDRNSD